MIKVFISGFYYAGLGMLFAAHANAIGSFETADATRQAFSQLYQHVNERKYHLALLGRQLFRQSWVIPPAIDNDVSGLGPLYNQIACVSCHPKNGRGKAPDRPDQNMRSMLVRISVPGRTSVGAPLPHPVYGDQINEQGVPGVPGEGRMEVSYRHQRVTLTDGERIDLRVPSYEFTELQYGPLPEDIQLSPRIAPTVFGLGLLEAVPERLILKLSQKQREQGLQGRPNYVWDSEHKRFKIGRFGLKANVSTLRQQITGAFLGDMGITSTLHPKQNCTSAQTACRQAPSSRQPELSDTQLESVLLYLRLLKAPGRRDVSDAAIQQGEKLFTGIGCALCHVPTLTTGQFPELPELSQQVFHPYTDLLLHDMGPGLADNRPDFNARGQDWRTPPLWGIGLVNLINGHSHFLHDGRARNFTEAILWHDGEAFPSRQRFEDLATEDRRSLIRFLSSL